MSSLWAYWAPPAERSRLVGVANAGAQIGNVILLKLNTLINKLNIFIQKGCRFTTWWLLMRLRF